MKKAILIVVLILCGCSSTGIATPNGTPTSEIKIGLTKQQIFKLCSSPIYWSKHQIGSDTYESWYYETTPPWPNTFPTTYDFKNGILTGYSFRGRYFDATGCEDVRNYNKK